MLDLPTLCMLVVDVAHFQDPHYLRMMSQPRPAGYTSLSRKQVSATSRIDAQIAELVLIENMAVKSAGNIVCLSTDGGKSQKLATRMIMADFGRGPDIQHCLLKQPTTHCFV